MLIEAKSRQEKAEDPYRPPLSTYSAEVEMLTAMGNELRLIRRVLELANGAKHAGQPVLYPQPYTALEQAQVARREERHKELVARVLPHKTQ